MNTFGGLLIKDQVNGGQKRTFCSSLPSLHVLATTLENLNFLNALSSLNDVRLLYTRIREDLKKVVLNFCHTNFSAWFCSFKPLILSVFDLF